MTMDARIGSFVPLIWFRPISRFGDSFVLETTSVILNANIVMRRRSVKVLGVFSMGYSRPWESTPPVETFDLTVVVK